MFAALIDELMGQTSAELDDTLAAAKRARDEADATIAAVTAVIGARQLHQDHGHHTIGGYLRQQLNCPAAEARRITRRSRLLNHHPDIGDRLADSRIGAAQVDLLADAHHHRVAGDRFAEFAPLLTEHAEQLDHADFRIAIERFITNADPDGTFNTHQFHDEQRIASAAIHDGAIDLHASGGDPLRATEMKTAFDRACEAEFRRDCDTRRRLHGDGAAAHPLPRTAGQRRFDALYAMIIASTTAPADGKRPEPLVNIVIDPITAIEALVRHGLLGLDNIGLGGTGLDAPVDPLTRRCHTTTGTAIHPDLALRAMLRGHVRRVIVDADDVVINLGRTRRLFTGKARDAARLLVTRCAYRGCDIPAEFCDTDHIDEWSTHHGATDQHNALPLCGTHDRWKHRERLRGRRDRHGRIHLIKPDGTVIKPLNTADPQWTDPDPPPARPSRFAPASRTMTWAEWTRGRTPQRDSHIDPMATVTIHHLRPA